MILVPDIKTNCGVRIAFPKHCYYQYDKRLLSLFYSKQCTYGDATLVYLVIRLIEVYLQWLYSQKILGGSFVAHFLVHAYIFVCFHYVQPYRIDDFMKYLFHFILLYTSNHLTLDYLPYYFSLHLHWPQCLNNNKQCSGARFAVVCLSFAISSSRQLQTIFDQGYSFKQILYSHYC